VARFHEVCRQAFRVGSSTPKKTGRYGDGGGLWLQVSASGGKSWIFRFMYDGRERHMGLGPVDVVSLAEARELARENRRVLFEGRDPLVARHAAREAAKAVFRRGILTP